MKLLRQSARLAAAAALLMMPLASPAQAQNGDDGGVTGRLIELLVKKGVLPRDEADALLREARAEAAHPKKRAVRSVEATAPPAPSEPPKDTEPTGPNTVRVTYVPQFIRDEIASQVRADLTKAAQESGSAAQPAPGWTDRFTFFGDLRIRGELDQLPSTNVPQIFDFAGINGGSPFDLTGTSGAPPLLNTTHYRWRERLRARAGFDVKIDDGVMAELRIATGNDASPVTANQTFGQNGPFTKYAVWLDRAFVRADPFDWLTLYAGRMPNPFWTTDIVYYEDLGFDGFAMSAAPRISKSVSVFATAGAFPVFNTAFNFGSTSINSSFASRDAWLFAVQGGGTWRIRYDIAAKFAAGYFSYSNVEGKLSSPCTLTFSSDTCDTDNTRALFPSNGNTMIPLRTIVSAPNNTQPQFFGLASPFRVLDLHGKVDLDMFKPVVISFESDFAVNLAFDRPRIAALGFNNFSAGGKTPDAGNKAWMAKVTVGTPAILERWDWNFALAYKYIESDSVLASLNDSDFHLGGTNAKGFVLMGNLGIAHNTWLTARWLSSTQVSGPTYAIDVVQADLNVRF